MSQQAQPAAAIGAIQTWTHDGRSLPGWLHPWMIGRVEANGTFLIQSRLGRQRVHHGNVVVEQGGDVYAWAADEVDERVAELRDRIVASSRPANMVGPGKSLKTAIPSTRKANQGRKTERARSYPPVRGTPPSIEWVSACDTNRVVGP